MIQSQFTENNFLSFKEGEEEGFNYFFHELYKPLVHFAFTLLHNTEAAQDVAEDSFLKLWEKRETIESLSSIRPYLYATVHNRCIDLIRKQKHQAAHIAHLKKAGEKLAPDVAQGIIISESMHQLYLAIQNLPSKYNRIFNMLYVQGKEIKEIARELNLPLSTVKSQKQRALELLRQQLPHLGYLLVFFFLNAG